MRSSRLYTGRNDEIESQRSIKKSNGGGGGNSRDFRVMRQLFLLLHPLISTLKIAGKTLLYRRLFASRLPRYGLTFLTKSSRPSLEAFSTLIRIADMLRGVDPSRNRSDRALSSRLLSKIDDVSSWIFIGYYPREPVFLVNEITTPCRGGWWSLSCILIHEFHKKPTVDHPRKNESRSIDFFRGCSVRDYRRL